MWGFALFCGSSKVDIVGYLTCTSTWYLDVQLPFLGVASCRIKVEVGCGMILPPPTGTESAVSVGIGIFSDVLAGVFQLPP